MQVEVRGALRFQHRAALEKGVTAFDSAAYPEFFRSELWTLVGSYALCEYKFEIEPDCDYTEAFLAMARNAVEGSIDLRERKRKTFTQVHKVGKPLNRWLKAERSASFGEHASELRAAWAAHLDKARTDDAAKAAKKLAKDAGRCVVVELPRNPSQCVVRPDGSLAVAAGSKVYFVSAGGELLGSSECKLGDYDQIGLGITALHALPDGRVLAFQELDHEGRVATLGAPLTRVIAPSPAGGDRPVSRASSDGTLTVLQGRHSAVVLEASCDVEREIVPWPDDYVFGVLAWRGRVVAWSSNKTAVFERDGTKRFEVAGANAIAAGDRLIVLDHGGIGVVDENGADVARWSTGSIGWVRGGNGTSNAVAVRDGRVIVGTSLPDGFGAWDLAGKVRWRVKSHTIGVAGCVAQATWDAAWAEEPIVSNPNRPKDTTIAAYRDGVELARVDVKATVLGAVAVGDDALAAWCDGRTAGSKVLLWRAVSTAPTLETLTGHKGRVGGLVTLPDGRLVSWAADKTVRIWSV